MIPTWEYEIVTGTIDEVREELNQLGALGWELTGSQVAPGDGRDMRLVVFLRRSGVAEVPESAEVDLHEFPTFRPHT